MAAARGRPDALVFFGATGDLASKQIFPALAALVARGRLDIPVIGVANAGWDRDQLVKRVHESVAGHGGAGSGAAGRLGKLLRYVDGDYRDPGTFRTLRAELGQATAPLHYLAIPPALFGTVVTALKGSGSAEGGRVVVEKPFGYDLASAQALNAALYRVFPETSIFRIDHYLGKEAVLGLLYFRFANAFPEPVWNRTYVDSVQITMSEDFGVAGRGAFYDQTGAIRDVVQNHLLQVVALLAMEPPAGYGHQDVRDEKVKVLRAMPPLCPRDVIRGQYVGYTDEDGVAAGSATETYAALRACVDTWRWAGVPFFIRAGKRLPVTATEVVVRLRRPPALGGANDGHPPNHLRFLLSPDISISLGTRVKAPGEAMKGTDVELALHEQPGSAELAPYERLLGDALNGDASLFAREDAVEAAWAVVEPALGDAVPLRRYRPGTWGPERARDVMAGHGGWRDPNPGQGRTDLAMTTGFGVEVGRMAVTEIAHPSVDDRKAMGLGARDRAPLPSHSGWSPATDRPDPVALLQEQDKTREPDLVPVRHGRMMVSPFTFYRGAAKVMAADLAPTPVAGLEAQLCGDAHLSNFGVFASPERRLLFDINDFDETLPGPFEYDVKRMAASFTIAARHNGFSQADALAATMASVTAYREAMAGFAQMPVMDIWYASLDEDELLASIRAIVTGTAGQEKAAKKAGQAEKRAKAPKKAKKRTAKQEKAARREEKLARKDAKQAAKTVAKAHTRDSLQALSMLGEVVDGKYRIVSQPPLVVPLRDLAATFGLSAEETEHAIRGQFRAYRQILQDDRRLLLERFEIADAARKVVGVGSVGTQAFIVLLQGRDAQDPLFLQVKEATASVLEPSVRKSRYRQHGKRVVQGQRLMQAASDIYLGWTKGPDERRHFYWRQLRDMKGSVDVEAMMPFGLTYYARICGWTLARAHARSGDPIAIAAYLGGSHAFDTSATDFAERYADQNEQDYQEFVKAVRSGRLEATDGV